MRFVVALFVVPVLLLASPVRAQVDSREGIALQNEIYQLRQELRTFEDQMSRGGGSGNRAPAYAPAPVPSGGNDLLAQLLTRVDALEEQVRQLRGRIDETQNALQMQNADLGKRIDDLAFKINPTDVAAPPAQPPPRVPDGAPPPPLVLPGSRPAGPRTPEVALQEGNAALARRDYPVAEAAAREVLANRTSPRAYDARLMLAQALEGQKQYAQSAIAFDDAYNASRKGSHAQDALVGLALSLNAINEKKAACDTLANLRQNFKPLHPDIQAGAAAIGQKAGCR
jgi:TolA-binding protein